MKKVTLLFAALALLSMSVIGQPILQWRYANPTVYNNGTDCVLQFDVELSCTVAGTFHSSLQLYYDYNTLGFGTNIVANNKVSFTRLPLMQGQFAGVDKYIINNYTDNTDHTFAILTEASFIIVGATFMNEVPQLPNWGGYFQFTIIIADEAQMAGVAFRPDLMDGGNYYVDATHPTETKYGVPPLYAGVYDNNLMTQSLTCTTGKTWNGALSPDWFDGGNWTPAGFPVAGDDVVIPEVITDAWYPIIIGGAATIANITIAPLAELQVGATGALTVTGATVVDGLLHIIDGSFIDNGVSGTGLFEYDRYVAPESLVNEEEWHYISSPVNNAVSGDLTGYMLKYWDRDFNGGWWIDVDPCGSGGAGCFPTSFLNIGLNVGQGYSVKHYYPCDNVVPNVPETGDVVEFGGDWLGAFVPFAPNAVASPTDVALITQMNTGNYAIPMAGANNWVLMGNPYPSGWDYDLFWAGPNFAAANIADAIYFWDGTLQQYATYIGGFSTNGGDNEVPPTQGFLFDALGAGTMNFTNAERIHTAIPFWKAEPANMISLTVSGEKFRDETVVCFNEEATTMFDVNYDAKKLFSTSTLVPSLYTKSNFDLSINSMPQVEAVPVYFSGPEGYYTISAITDMGLVYLEDKETGAFHDLTTSYAFYNAGGAEGRFVLHFGLSNELANNGYVIYSYANNIYVNNLNNVSGTISVYTMMGQEVSSVNMVGGLNTISMSEQNTTYIVKVLGSTATVSEKVYIR